MEVYLSGFVRCSFRYLLMEKHLILSVPKTGSMVASGVKNCLFSGSWRLASFKYAHSLLTT